MAKKTMTYEEAIRRINNVLDPYPAFPSLPVETCEAIEMALTALKEKAEAESKAKNHPSGKTNTNEDVIYRKDAISAIRECYIKEVTPAYRLIDKAEALSAILGVEAIKASNDDVTAGQPHPEPYKKDMEGINGLIDMQMAIDTAIEAVDAWDGGHNAERAEIIKRYFVENIPNDMPINPDYISRQAAIKECVKGKVEGSPATNLACDLCAERIKNLLPKWTDIINRHDAIEECLKGKSIELPAASLACQNCAERIKLLPSIRKCIDDGNCIRYYSNALDSKEPQKKCRTCQYGTDWPNTENTKHGYYCTNLYADQYGNNIDDCDACDLFEEKRKTIVRFTNDDCISRQAAIDAVMQDVSCIRTHEFNAGATRAANRIKQLPPAQPEPHWIPVIESMPEESGRYFAIAIKKKNGKEVYGIVEYHALTHQFIAWDSMTIIAWYPIPDRRRIQDVSNK